MLPKPAPVERSLILSRDDRRRYGVRVVFHVEAIEHFGGMENVTILLPSGAIAVVSPARQTMAEPGIKLQMSIEGFATASKAEEMGLLASQSLLMTAVDRHFGLRLEYQTHEPGTVYDRLRAPGLTGLATLIRGQSPDLILTRIIDGFSRPVVDRRLFVSMELYAAALLEPSYRARFVMLVSALEPLAVQQDLGEPVNDFVVRAIAELEASPGIEEKSVQSLRGRLLLLRQESVRQALLRLFDKWFPCNRDARLALDRCYGLRSELLHEGKPRDPDTQFVQAANEIAGYISLIHRHELSTSA